ncbi:MAG TPA: thermonuclease family protein [Gammaproteobacteria bacterium]|nr:thermonuclease family protein [Gammaproteobacteria bacterium]
MLIPSLAPRAAGRCGADRVDAQVRVTYVYDGDTVRLADGRHLRLIGIDTPELHPDHGGPQPLAEAARDQLRALLQRHRYQLRLRFDQDRQDRYHRLLAHAFLNDGSSVERRLLDAGLGTALVVPPNLWHLTCYHDAQAVAQHARRGLWALPAYQPVAAARLPRDADGFHLLTGRVTAVRGGRRGIWLQLDGPVVLRIPRGDLIYFVGHDLPALKGQRVLAQGWLHRSFGDRSGWFMAVRHPEALEVLR